ncbi:TIGR04219 family outer membrane beta-barrel protein [Desulfoluna spongiiphila]|uniref:Outer membrane protein n=1 Tax=Desulfoluna spongiiphila TaxID=419481 RepID=A0A1G5AMI9_9BACT|nr:TIGR04219 family outer membrane beta-barrel protein [Desulfoluna spongiiphila]SCX79106.1 outer membrane protein [Desulfoluna spongiiphila]
MKRWLFILLAVAAVMVPGRSFALLGLVSVEGAVGGFMPSPSGDFQYGSGDSGDLESILGFDNEVFPAARLRVELPLVIPNVYLMASPMEFEGNLTEEFDYGDKTFAANSATKLTLNQYDMGLFYGVPFVGLATLGRLGLDVGLDIRVVDIEAEMTDSVTKETRTESATVPVPLLFVAGQLKLIGGFAVEAEIRGLDVSYARIISAIGRVKYNTMGPLFIAAGYRHEEVEVDEDDFDVDLTFAGPFAEVGFSF